MTLLKDFNKMAKQQTQHLFVCTAAVIGLAGRQQHWTFVWAPWKMSSALANVFAPQFIL